MSIKWVSHGSWWWTGKTGMLQYMGSQRVRRNWIELNWTDPGCIIQVTDWACIQVIIRYGLKDIWGKDGKDLYVDIAAKSLQSCPTLCNPIDSSPPGSPVPGILQARTLEWVVISFSNAWKWKMKVKSLSCVWLFATQWIAALQAPPPMGFSRQEYWSGVPLPSPMWTLNAIKRKELYWLFLFYVSVF